MLRHIKLKQNSDLHIVSAIGSIALTKPTALNVQAMYADLEKGGMKGPKLVFRGLAKCPIVFPNQDGASRVTADSGTVSGHS